MASTGLTRLASSKMTRSKRTDPGGMNFMKTGLIWRTALAIDRGLIMKTGLLEDRVAGVLPGRGDFRDHLELEFGESVLESVETDDIVE